MATFFENYSKIRDNLGLTDYQISKALGIAASNINYWKTRNSIPNYETIVKLSDFFKVPTDALVVSSKAYEENEKLIEYWNNSETAKIAQKIFENKELRLLFDSAVKAMPEDLTVVNNMLLALKKKEKKNGNNNKND